MRKEQPTKRLQVDRTFAFDRTFLCFLDGSIWRYFQRALLKNAENTITNRKLRGSLYIFSTANEKFPFEQANFIINFASHVRTTNLLESSLWVINKSLKSSQEPFVDSPRKKLLFFQITKKKQEREREREREASSCPLLFHSTLQRGVYLIVVWDSDFLSYASLNFTQLPGRVFFFAWILEILKTIRRRQLTYLAEKLQRVWIPWMIKT